MGSHLPAGGKSLHGFGSLPLRVKRGLMKMNNRIIETHLRTKKGLPTAIDVMAALVGRFQPRGFAPPPRPTYAKPT